ncbi:flagellar M-ring protein FliF [Rhodovulum tesquicola]|uniref:flagellar basal-body MS-ring/collar protein FliF n=1 Tax=Rhodovulum tesquicola TaxID=540254 RepID=UPI0020983F90|nr:flagellar basal-body MS-ring/collar protein FliF [Rhodovulum tesquicola]MCO8143791.1 flagellar M-ring protein FliF [Rhodovulum tesquicola]
MAIWTGLTPRRRVIVILATVAMFAAVLLLSRVATAPRMALLYSGLDTAAAGEVIRALDQAGVAYEVRGPAIYADARHRDSLRMTLASEGLPANGAAGYELLDGLSGFGTTSQMFDAAYWRAKEGELARTILANPQFRSARVHIATPSARPFARNVKPAAAVTVGAAGGPLAPAQAKALRYLVAASVAGMMPADVSVIDANTGTVVSEDGAASLGGDAEDRAEALKARLERLLAARLGPGRAVVEVSIETETQSESIRERRIDPESRIAISSENEQRSTSASETGGGAVTVASNLPEGAGASDRQSQRKENQTQERVNYEVSQTEREILRAPGALKRLSVAVLVDGVAGRDEAGKPTWEPLPEAEIEALRELVASAAGFDDSRGDVITLKSMPFEPVEALGSGPGGSLFSEVLLDPLTLIQLAVLAVVALILGLFVVRPILAGGASGASASLPPPQGAGAGQTWLDGEIDPDDGFAPGLPMGTMAMNTLDPAEFTDSGFGGGGFADGGFGASATDPVGRLRDLIEERREESVAILRGWMEERQETPS